MVVTVYIYTYNTYSNSPCQAQPTPRVCIFVYYVRVPGSRPGIMWTCIVRVTGIMSMMSEGEGIQHACGQFEHAIDSVNLARVKRKEKKRGKHGFRSISCSN
jgi:hypothetical protein